jgi:hypothetical protein
VIKPPSPNKPGSNNNVVPPTPCPVGAVCGFVQPN